MAAVLIRPAAAAQIVAAKAAGDRLSIRAQAVQTAFAPGQPVECLIVFKNVSDDPLTLPVTEFLGTHTLGIYRYSIRDVESGETWKVGIDPEATLPAAPATIEPVRLQPSDSYVTRIPLPGVSRQFWQGDDSLNPVRTVNQLPAGTYELSIQMELPTEKLTVGPLPFKVSDRALPSTAAPAAKPPAAVTKAAEQFLTERLELYRRANRGEPPWDRLTSGSFQFKGKSQDGFWEIEYLAELPQQRQNVRLELAVSDAGNVLSPNAGFVVISVSAPPIPPHLGN